MVRCSDRITSSVYNDSSGGRWGVVSQSDLFEKAKMYNLEKVGPMLNLGQEYCEENVSLGEK